MKNNEINIFFLFLKLKYRYKDFLKREFSNAHIIRRRSENVQTKKNGGVHSYSLWRRVTGSLITEVSRQRPGLILKIR